MEEREWLALCAKEAAQQGGNAIEAYAWATACERHRPFIRGCAWMDDKPCECRTKAIETRI